MIPLFEFENHGREKMSMQKFFTFFWNVLVPVVIFHTFTADDTKSFMHLPLFFLQYVILLKSLFFLWNHRNPVCKWVEVEIKKFQEFEALQKGK